MSRFIGTYKIFLLLCLSTLSTLAQQGNVWIFGDSARLDYSQPGATLRSVVWGALGTATICDTSGNLLLYSTYTSVNGVRESGIYNANNQLLQNGDTIYNVYRPNNNIIIPYPGYDSLFLLFTLDAFPISPPHPIGIYYSIINPFIGTNGVVVQKNIPFLTGNEPSGLFTALRHGNGRDWWIYFSFTYINGTTIIPHDSIFKVLVSPLGISSITSQTIGTPNIHGNGTLTFSKVGEKAAICLASGLIELYDVDRCTGIFSNPVSIRPPNTLAYPNPAFSDIEFSPNGRFLYTIALHEDTSFIYQIDLLNMAPWINKVNLFTWYYPEKPFSLARWLDDKIYTSQDDRTSSGNDTLHTLANSTIGRIEYPDSLGLSCQFNPYSVYLNGARSTGSLPNNPDFELGKWQNSICDTLSTGIENISVLPNELLVWPVPTNDVLNLKINESLKCSNIQIISVDGKVVRNYPTHPMVHDFTFDVADLVDGFYSIRVFTQKIIMNHNIKIMH